MRNTDFSIIDFDALGAVTGGCKQKQQPPPPQQQPQMMAPPQQQACDTGVEVTVATGAQAAALMGNMLTSA